MWYNHDEYPIAYKEIILYIFCGRTQAGTPIYSCSMGYWAPIHGYTHRNVIKWCYPPTEEVG